MRPKPGQSIPIGGIGAGYAAFDADLTIDRLAMFNDWSNPMRVVRGFHLVLLGEEPLFLQGNPGRNVETPPRYSRAKIVDVDAVWPKIKYAFEGPIKEVEIYSPIIPRDLRSSSLPLIYFKIRGRGAVALSFPNVTGRRYGRANFSVRRGPLSGVVMTNLRSSQSDPAHGEIFIGCDGCRTYAGYSVYVPAETRGMTEDVSVFYRLREAEDPGHYYIEKYAREEIAGIVWREIDGEGLFVLSWYARGRPYHYPYGHYYESWFPDAVSIAEYGLRERLEPRLDVEAEGWLRDALLNSLYVLSATSWLTKDGRFALYETPWIAPLMNTIGSMTWDGAGFALLELFPDLVVKADEMFAAYRRGGEIPHDYGEESLEDPIYGATYITPWKDLASTWVLMIYRDYYYTGDLGILRRNIEAMKDAVDWLMSLDRDGDCIPDSRGRNDNSYDGSNMYGRASYVASLFLCALTAYVKAAERLGLSVDGRYLECLERGKRSFEGLWNGMCYSAWVDGARRKDTCMSSQLLGQFWCDMLDLPPIVPEDRAKAALRSIYELGMKASRHCVPNSTTLEGEVDRETDQLRSCWTRVNFAVAAHMLLRGMEKEGWDVAEREWRTISELDPWNINSRIDAIEGRNVGLQYYISSPTVWLVYLAERKRKGLWPPKKR